MPVIYPPVYQQIGGNTAGASALISTGTLTLAGGNNITLSQAGNAITISGGAGGSGVAVQPGGNTAGTGTAVVSTGTLVLAGGNNITLSQAGNSITISGGAGGGGVAVQPAGNTAGTGGSAVISTGTLTLAGGNNITLSQAGNALTIVGPTTAGFNMQIAGNTAGTGGTAQISSGTLTLAGGNNITLSQAGNAITISGGAGGGAAIGMSNIGNTSGTSGTFTSGTVIVSGGNNITVSQVTGAGGATINVSGGLTAPTLNYWANMDFANQSSSQSLQNNLVIIPITPAGLFPGNMTVSTMLINVSGSSTATATTAGHTFSYGLYIASATTNLLLVASATTAFSVSNMSGQSSLYHGPRWLSVTGWSSNTALTGALTSATTAVTNGSLALSNGPYWIGYAASTSVSNRLSYIGVFHMGAGAAVATARFGTLGSSVATSGSGFGIGPSFGFSATNSLITSVAFSALNNGTSVANFVPHIVFNNNNSAF